MNIEKIRKHYNAEFDLPVLDSPPVTWVEMELAEEVHKLKGYLNQTLDRINELQTEVAGLQESHLSLVYTFFGMLDDDTVLGDDDES